MKTLCSYIESEYITEFVKSGKIKKYDTVDLGLPSGNLWCDRNVGASTVEDAGLLFQWGFTDGFKYGASKPKDNYQDEDKCIHPSGKDSFKDYKTDSHNSTDILDPADDAAAVFMGKGWMMPSMDDFKELFNNTDHKWTEQNGQPGTLLTSKNNGNTLFIPVSGCWSADDEEFYNEKTYGYLWTSSYYRWTSWYIWFNDKRCAYDSCNRSHAFIVRGVKK